MLPDDVIFCFFSLHCCYERNDLCEHTAGSPENLNSMNLVSINVEPFESRANVRAAVATLEPKEHEHCPHQLRTI